MFKLIGKEINAILGAQTIRIWTYVSHLLCNCSTFSLLSFRCFSESSILPEIKEVKFKDFSRTSKDYLTVFKD